MLPPGERSDEVAKGLRRIEAAASRTVGIAGAEGAGKSTLLNAIVGAAVVPTDSDVAGTVAPIFIRSGGAAEPAFQVVMQSLPDQATPTDSATFRDLLLQRTNPGNEKNVYYGLIDVASPFLAAGMSLVDLPGLGGMDTSFRRLAEAALPLVDGTIVVVFERAVGPALDAIRLIRSAGREVDAIVVNLRTDRFLDAETEAPIQNEAAASLIEEFRRFVGASVRQADLVLPDERIFAFHTPSMSGLQMRSNGRVRLAANTAEIDRFAIWFLTIYGPYSAALRLEAGLNAAGRVMALIADDLEREAVLVEGVASGHDTARTHVRQAVAALEAAVPARLTAAKETAGVDDGAALTQCEQAVAALKRDVVRLADRMQGLVPTDWSGKDWQLAKRIATELNSGTKGLAERIHDEVVAIVSAYMAQMREAAAIVARDANGVLPVELPAVDLFTVNVPPVWTPPKFDESPGGLGEFLDSANIIERLIREARTVEMLIDPSRFGPIGKIVRECQSRVEAEQVRCIRKRSKVLETIAEGGERHLIEPALQRLASQRQVLAASEQAASVCRAWLDQPMPVIEVVAPGKVQVRITEPPAHMIAPPPLPALEQVERLAPRSHARRWLWGWLSSMFRGHRS